MGLGVSAKIENNGDPARPRLGSIEERTICKTLCSPSKHISISKLLDIYFVKKNPHAPLCQDTPRP